MTYLNTTCTTACAATGFVQTHAELCEQVAAQLDCYVLFREPGVMAQGLIEEHYSMKGFRIDTKSCNWGPMAGFVCADPRLTKDEAYIDKNEHWTKEALTGEINEKFFGEVPFDPEWLADVMPIVISVDRIAYLMGKGIIRPWVDRAFYHKSTRRPGATAPDLLGISIASKGDTILPWRLVPVGNARESWLIAGGARPNHYVVCVDNSPPRVFKQRYPVGVRRVRFRGEEAILGMINPGTKHRGFKACVTADYDLFAIWPREAGRDRMAMQHQLNAAVLKKVAPVGEAQVFGPRNLAGLAGGVARLDTIDTRLKQAQRNEHHRYGDVSARVMLVKTMLNSALAGSGKYQGGNAIHHNDEAGNLALAKPNLQACLPIIAFTPNAGAKLLETTTDFKDMYADARRAGYTPVAKQEWLA